MDEPIESRRPPVLGAFLNRESASGSDFLRAIMRYPRAHRARIFAARGHRDSLILLTIGKTMDDETVRRIIRSAEHDFCEALRIAHRIEYRKGVASYTGTPADSAPVGEDWPKDWHLSSIKSLEHALHSLAR